MNFKSFPGPQRHIGERGRELGGRCGLGELWGDRREGVSGSHRHRQTLGGPYVPILGGPLPATEVPKTGAFAGAMGEGAPGPSCLPPPPSLGRRGVCRRDSVCPCPNSSPPDPHTQTQAADCAHPPPRLASLPTRTGHTSSHYPTPATPLSTVCIVLGSA